MASVWVRYLEYSDGVDSVYSYPIEDGEEFEVREPDDDTEEIALCGVGGDWGVMGLCGDCAPLWNAVSTQAYSRVSLWARADLDAWLQDKGINPRQHFTGGRFWGISPAYTTLDMGLVNACAVPINSVHLTEHRS